MVVTGSFDLLSLGSIPGGPTNLLVDSEISQV